MSSRRTAILIIAIAIGVIAVLLIVKYVNGIQEEATGAATKVTVFAAKENIPRGSDGGQAFNEKKIVETSVPQEFRPATSIQSPDAIQKKVAVFPISPGTIIVDGMFVDPTTVTISFRERLKNKSRVAISIKVNPMTGVGGFLVPGDEVNMMVYQDNESLIKFLETPPEDTNTDTGLYPDLNILRPKPAENIVGAGGAQWIIFPKTARYLYQKVQVLAVGSNQLLGPGEAATDASTGEEGETTTTASSQSDNSLITLSVPAEAAQWIATGQGFDTGFYLSLVAQGYEPTPLRPLPLITDVLPGEDPAKLTPYAGEQG